jgi:predicted sugar kinase
LTDALSLLILTEVLPAVEGEDFDSFATGLGDYGRRVGEAFSELQGGVVHRGSLGLWYYLRQRGVEGVAQTSWGPTLAVVQPSVEAAERLAKEIRDEFEGGSRLSMVIAAGRNRGAEIR